MSDIVIDREQGLNPYSDPDRYYAELDHAIAAMVEGSVEKHASHDQETHGNWADATATQDPRTMHDWKAWGKTWSDADKWVVDRYQGGAGGTINGWLRGRTQDEDDLSYLARYGQRMTPEQATAQIDALIASAPPLPDEGHVYRLLTHWPEGDDVDNVPASIMRSLATNGTQFTDAAFVSTTAEMGFIERIVHSDASSLQGRRPIRRIMEIHIPKGTRVAYLPVGGNDSFEGEQEVLLPRGGTFTVRKVLSGGRTLLNYEPPKEYVA